MYFLKKINVIYRIYLQVKAKNFLFQSINIKKKIIINLKDF